MRTASICWAMVLASVRGQMQYRLSFATEVASGLLFQSMGFVFVWAILARFETLGGWSLGEVAVLYGLRLSAHGIWVLMFSQLYRFDGIVREGEYDRFLIRPVPAIFQLMFTSVRVTVIGDFIGGLVILGAALSRAQIEWTPALVVFLIASVLLGSLIDGAFQLGPAGLAFRFLDTLPIRITFDDIFSRFGGYPVSIFGQVAQWAFTSILPIAFMAYIPASVLLGRTSELIVPAWLAWMSPVVCVVAFAIGLRFFLGQSRHYQSSGH